jgi:glycosyltransferase involved in cell wall biosynthesis
MKVVVFDHIGNMGGGTRFVEQLLLSIVKVDNSIEIDFFCNPVLFKRESFLNNFVRHSIRVKKLHSLWFKNPSTFVEKIFNRISLFVNRITNNPPIFLGNLKKEIQVLTKGYDIAFFPWPFLIADVELRCPKVAVFHDFNFKYFFGVPIFSSIQEKDLNVQIEKWLQSTYPVVSTNFMKTELELHYPKHKYATEVIHLAPLVEIINTEKEVYLKLEEKFYIKKPYILYPTHVCAHKNLLNLIVATCLVNSSGRPINVVFVGNGTETVNGIATISGLKKSLNISEQNVFGLGYVSNIEINSLFDNCYAVISTSIYEAGNGPGLDGWARGKPVLMSNIPSFVEHLAVQKVKAMLFDPLNYKEIAKSICYLIDNYEECLSDALLSKEELNKSSWDDVASLYINKFKEVIDKARLE